jgi:hypothetical protein
LRGRLRRRAVLPPGERALGNGRDINHGARKGTRRTGFPEFCEAKLRKIKTVPQLWEGESRRLSPAQGIEAVYFFAAGKKDTSG